MGLAPPRQSLLLKLSRDPQGAVFNERPNCNLLFLISWGL